jgi:hypothetical protein
MPKALQVLIADAERVAPQLVPDVNKLPALVGVIAQHLEALAGGEITALTDEALGIAPPAPPADAAASGKTAEEQLAEAQAKIRELEAAAAKPAA